MRPKLALALAALLVLAATAHGTPYWIAWEGDDFPENDGWLRVWGDEDGPQQGGAIRTLDDGIMTSDGLRSDQICDFSEMQRSIDSGPGESFIAEWRVRVDPQSQPGDTNVTIARDQPPGYTNFKIGPASVLIENDGVEIGLELGEFHSFRFASIDMRSYTLAIDSTFTYQSHFDANSILSSFVNFGDGVQGQASLAQWDYFRFGVVPEPGSLATILVGFAGRNRFV